jgi:AraC-like DNA-binding protein/uncharacterized cupin superfamily protein
MEPDILAFVFRAGPGQNLRKARHVHDHHEFLYCLEGSSIQLNAWGEERCSQGDLFFFPAGQPHLSYLRADQATLALVVSLSERLFSPGQDADRPCLSVLAQLRRDAERTNRVRLSKAGSAAVGAEFQALVAEFEARRPGHECAVKSRAMGALLAVLRDPEFRLERANALVPLSRQALVQEVLWYLRLNYMRRVTLAEVLAFCPMSRSHFHAVFRQATGKTMSAALREVRVEKAKELLRGSRASVLEVALDCGFGSQSHFCHAFKAAAGASPRRWRESQPPLAVTAPAPDAPGPSIPRAGASLSEN